MKKTGITLIIFLCTFIFSCNEKTRDKSVKELSIFEKVESVPDSIKVDDIIIYNLFKYQILAHKNDSFDSIMIIDKVYNKQPKIWKELYGVLFDHDMFATEKGMVKWNKEIFRNKKDSIKSRVNTLLDCKFDSTLNASLAGIKKLTGRTPKNIRLSIILAPVEGIGFGGMENDAFILDLLDNNFDVINMVEEGIPHEFNHFIYEPTRENDPNKNTPLRLTIDEGFACYYTYKYFDGKISKSEAVEQMTDDDWNWYLQHEKEVYNKCSPYFFYEGDEDPLRGLGREMNAPKTLLYWLGFRIIDFYVNKYGPDSWKDIYNLPVNEVLEKSGYIQYIDELK
ncbi:DUF2268 domain-containing putative Zn-dependent protease [Yeosuana marina]|uniref:DUF2268 domain-containing putative Zn-dependent protease n=1 Tax=Yeosuana marina TaxID=1565536 RepID=UPI0014247458|nr:DUF2268 domain-containing putative Zn-dependent protease [Yeosuana marina]